MKLNRLLEIILILVNRKKVTARELADKFGVSVRTIYRDIDVLSASNIPVYTEKGAGGGIYILPEYVMDKALLSETEQEEILFGLQSLKATGYTDKNPTLEKIGSLFNKKNYDWIEVDFSSWGTSAHDEKFRILKQALTKGLLVEFEYFNSYGTKRMRKVKPARLLFKYRAWYLQGYCLEQEGFRTYKITRMLMLHIINEYFQIPVPIEHMVDTQWDEPAEFITAQLRFKMEFAYRVYDEFEIVDISTLKNGDLVVNTEFPDCEWLYEMLLSYGNNCEIVGCQQLKDNFKQRLLIMLDKYN